MYYEVCGLAADGTYHISCALDALWVAESTAELWAEDGLTEIVINIWRAA